MPDRFPYYVIAPIDGLHATCDFSIYSAAIFGSPPSYSPTPTRIHEKYRQPYEYLTSLSISEYPKLTNQIFLDGITIRETSGLQLKRLKECSCLAYEVNFNGPHYAEIGDSSLNNALLQQVLELGERILDVLRLYLFLPGQDKSIGRLGALGQGIYGIWLGSGDGEAAKFIASRMSRYQLVQEPVEFSIVHANAINIDDVFRELCSVPCVGIGTDRVLPRVFDGLRALREARDLQTWEARFRQLGAIVESLAKIDETERLRGDHLRNRIAQITVKGWYTELQPEKERKPWRLPMPDYMDRVEWETREGVLEIVKDLWDNVRNPLAHTVSTFPSLSRDPLLDTYKMERIVLSMLQAIVSAWRLEYYVEKSTYEILLDD